MPEQPEQNLKNHARRDVPFLVAILILVVNFFTVLVQAVRADLIEFHTVTLLWIAVAGALVIIGFKARSNALKAQDRTIRLEERIRYATTLPTAVAVRAEALAVRQIVALRFASDAELPNLIDRALTENLTSKQIKESITTWRPDHCRV